jgi:hypothetical protein
MLRGFGCCNGVLASSRKNTHFLCQSRAKVISLNFQIIPRLQIQPKPLARAKIARQTQGGIRADRPAAMHDLVDATGRHAEIAGEAILRKPERLEKVCREHLARMNGTQLSTGHGAPSLGMLVIIDNLDLERIAVPPPEADSPLVVDANTVLACSAPAQFLQPIARRHTKIVKRLSGIECDELSEHHALKLRGEPSHACPREQSLGIAVGEGRDHSA